MLCTGLYSHATSVASPSAAEAAADTATEAPADGAASPTPRATSVPSIAHAQPPASRNSRLPKYAVNHPIFAIQIPKALLRQPTALVCR